MEDRTENGEVDIWIITFNSHYHICHILFRGLNPLGDFWDSICKCGDLAGCSAIDFFNESYLDDIICQMEFLGADWKKYITFLCGRKHYKKFSIFYYLYGRSIIEA